MDLVYTHARLMAALKGLAEGKKLADSVHVQPFGKSTKIIAALNDGAQHLNEAFLADHLEIVDEAFKKLGLARTSAQKNEVAAAILKVLVARRD
jgi:hypothetical protein